MVCAYINVASIKPHTHTHIQYKATKPTGCALSQTNVAVAVTIPLTVEDRRFPLGAAGVQTTRILVWCCRRINTTNTLILKLQYNGYY